MRNESEEYTTPNETFYQWTLITNRIIYLWKPIPFGPSRFGWGFQTIISHPFFHPLFLLRKGKGEGGAKGRMGDREMEIFFTEMCQMGPKNGPVEYEYSREDPKDGELHLGRKKPGETLVEVHRDANVQIARLT